MNVILRNSTRRMIDQSQAPVEAEKSRWVPLSPNATREIRRYSLLHILKKSRSANHGELAISGGTRSHVMRSAM
jgi:hypothetical protein